MPYRSKETVAVWRVVKVPSADPQYDEEVYEWARVPTDVPVGSDMEQQFFRVMRFGEKQYYDSKDAYYNHLRDTIPRGGPPPKPPPLTRSMSRRDPKVSWASDDEDMMEVD